MVHIRAISKRPSVAADRATLGQVLTVVAEMFRVLVTALTAKNATSA